ncbi:hypothetical protein MBEHAL_0602 [Halarchaeum acidiphilum MH1-52-1]|uniref:Uncharacterized protein n=1 Tax=Halarchaeum acidiphilum MH1-52-1 TaxID=1261545 RepID=U2YSZ0_9EURY|nr:hypothetical protein MBEHAL_0602 [Halarchaeum acidiphilum MH1-52-1]
MKCLNEPLMLFIREFSRPPGTVFVVDNLLERLVSEPFESVKPS